MDYRTKYEALLIDNKRLSKKLVILNSQLVICQQKCKSIEAAFDLSQKLIQQLKTENKLLRSSPEVTDSSLLNESVINNSMPISDITNIFDDNRPSNEVTTDPDQSIDVDMSSHLCKSDMITDHFEREIKELREDCLLLDCLPEHTVVITSEEQLIANSYLPKPVIVAIESKAETNSKIGVELNDNTSAVEMDVEIDGCDANMSLETTEQKRRLKCVVCGRKFTEESDLDNHQLLHKSSDGQQIRCAEELCGYQFDTKDELRKHLKAVHKNKTESKVTNPEPNPEPNSELNSTQNKPVFECSECKKQLSSKQYLRRHLKNVHNITPVYTCKVKGCGQTIEKWSDFKYHQQSHKKGNSITDEVQCVEEEVSPYFETVLNTPEGIVCELEAINKAKLRFVCPHEGCHSVYAYKQSLSLHIKQKHHSNGISDNTSSVGMDIQIDGCAPKTSKAKESGTDFQARLQMLELFHSTLQTPNLND